MSTGIGKRFMTQKRFNMNVFVRAKAKEAQARREARAEQRERIAEAKKKQRAEQARQQRLQTVYSISGSVSSMFGTIQAGSEARNYQIVENISKAQKARLSNLSL
jgi:cytidylate kinase